MRRVELDNLSFAASPNEMKFILLRSEKADDGSFLKEVVLPRIIKKQKNADMIPGVWGTLGYRDDQPIDWKGTFECSNEGNEDFSEESSVKDEVEIIKQMYPDLQLKGEIKEKVINLNQLDIPLTEIFGLQDIPQLRLTVFLGQDEGALAFYQFKKENTKDAEIEFIQPQPTIGNRTDNRDRLTYNFNVIPKKNIEKVPNFPNMYRLSSEDNEDDFIVKVLIFKRRFTTKRRETKIPKTSSEIVSLIEANLASYPNSFLVKDHTLRIFDSKKKTFIRAQPGSIDTTQKTLLLLHGTFASTDGSFMNAYDWLSTLIGVGKYDQILAFDHPTLFYDAEMNINILFKILDSIGIKSFDREVDIIGTSQGGLLAQYLANKKQESLKIGKVALIASANGVDYLTFAQGLTTGLKLFRKVMMRMGLAPAALISSLFQHSFEWVLRQPGLAVMKPGNKQLNDIIYRKPYASGTRYLPIAGNYESLNCFGKKKRIELAIDAILDEENDWVVGTKNQFKAPSDFVAIAGYNPGKFREYMINDAIHGSLIEKSETQHMLEQFFFRQLMGELMELSKMEFNDRFDSHCHLFGRNILSGRILLLLLGDLISYFDKKDESTLLEPIDLREKHGNGHGFSSVVRNIIKYIVLNKGAHQMLHDLEEDYFEAEANTYRYIPLMFDLEMTFRNSYDKNDANHGISRVLREFKREHSRFLKGTSKAIDLFEKKGEKVFQGNLIDNKLSVQLLKYVNAVLKGIDLGLSKVSKDTKDSYGLQIEEISQLKVIYGSDIFPFLATDPRRTGMGRDIKRFLKREKIFHGIKLYTPNGYSPTDPHFFNADEPFVEGKGLYQWCKDNNVPIVAHNSDAGFSTFADKLEVYGDICTKDPGDEEGFMYRLEFKDKEEVEFQYNIRRGGFNKAVKERAHRLNHPSLWRKVLNKYKTLRICFAHFGGGSEDWQDEIAQLILDFDNVYTDLSCQTNLDMLIRIREKYYDIHSPDNEIIRKRIMYGSDYFLNMLQGITFDNYYKNFKTAFTADQLEYMSNRVPKSFLGL